MPSPTSGLTKVLTSCKPLALQEQNQNRQRGCGIASARTYRHAPTVHLPIANQTILAVLLQMDELSREELLEQLLIERRRNRETTLPKFLDACNRYLHLGLRVESDLTQSTQGSAANASDKLRPNKLVEWEDFPQQQAAI